LRYIRLAVSEARADGIQGPILRRSEEFLDEEFQWIQQHGIASKEDYVAVERIGRTATRVTRAERPLLFDLYTRYLNQRQQGGKSYDWEDLASAVIRELQFDQSKRLYRHVIIDEGQDFSPEMLRSLAAAIPENGSLTFFGDIAQQISADIRTPDVLAKCWTYRDEYLAI
jgi:superfamily I DNA/RNA helicase